VSAGRGGLPERRPDQRAGRATGRSVAPGQRAQQVTNSKTKALTVQIINDPSEPVSTQIINDPTMPVEVEIVNSPTTPVEVQIVNNPTTPVVTEDGGIPGAQAISMSIGSGSTTQLLPASGNGYKLWSAIITSAAASTSAGIATPFIVEDLIQDSAGVQYLASEVAMALCTGSQPQNLSTPAPIDLRGITVPAGRAINLVNGGAAGTGALRRCSATLIYTVL